MNGFEKLSHRRIIDYTDAGQWVEVYDGPIEECESEKLKAENAKLRELVEGVLQCCGEIKRDKGCDACPLSNLGSTKNFTDGTWCKLRPTMRELGIEVHE